MSPRTQHRTIFFARIATLLYTILICILSLMPGKDVPLSSVSDKYRHALAYGVFAILIGVSFLEQRFRAAAIAFAVASFVGVAMELAQPRFGRTGDVADALANSIGATIGCGIVVGIVILVRKSRRRYVLTSV